MAVAVGQRCVVRIQITDINLRNAKEIMATIVSPQGDEKCQDISFDEVSGLVYATVDVNSAGNWSMWLNVRFANEVLYTPVFVFAEVGGDAMPCDAPYIVDVEVAGESVSVTPPKIDVDAVTREEFEQLSKDVAGKVDKVEGKGLSTNDFTNEYKQKVDEVVNRVKTDNNYTDADKALVQTIPNLATKNEVDTVRKSTTEAIKGVRTELEAKANKKGYYPSMSVGMADNLVGRGDTQDAQINFRPSAGADNITDGAARIERIKGNSVVYNQLWKTSYKLVNVVRTTVAYEDNIVTISANGVSQYAIGKFSTGEKIKLTPNHKFYVSVKGELNGSMRFGVYQGGVETSLPLFVGTGEKQVFEGISSSTDVIREVGGALLGESDSVVFDTSTLKLIDLTQMFGAGNEPTTVEEYYQRKPINIEDEFADNAGTLVDMNVNRLISTSDNAYDYTKGYARVMGGYKYDITANAGATLEVSFYADGEDDNEEREIAPDSEGKYTFPANGICYVNGDFASRSDICVCLNHSYDKPHPAYQQEVKDLSFIGEAFPEGMRSISIKKDVNNTNINADFYDEICFNPTTNKWEAIRRIGVVDLGSLDMSYSAGTGCFLTTGNSRFFKSYSPILSSAYAFIRNGNPTTLPDMHISSSPYFNTGVLFMKNSAYADVESFKQAMQEQGVKLYYELAEPIVEDIEGSENWNLDYFAWDFGTEEAIASVPSAPFRADINYEPNAVDDLRWAVSEIRKLRAELAQVSTTNLTE